MTFAAWPQYTMIFILGLGLVFNLISDCGKETKSDRISGVFISILVLGLMSWILWAGGFWSKLAT